jgi:hypothetical protein
MDNMFIPLDKTMAKHSPETKKKIYKDTNEGIKFHTSFIFWMWKFSVSLVPISVANSVASQSKDTLKEISTDMENFKVLKNVAL